MILALKGFLYLTARCARVAEDAEIRLFNQYLPIELTPLCSLRLCGEIKDSLLPR